MGKKKDEDAIDLEKGDAKIHIKFKTIIALIIILFMAIIGVIILYSDWKIGIFSHDASDVPKPQIRINK